MNTVIFIDGGAGRVICTIPALEKYVLDHPKENIKILVYGWDSLLWSNSILQPLTFNGNDKGTFANHIKNADKIISPEPYRLPEFFTQKVSMIEAFDILLNGNNNKLSNPKLYLSKSELIGAKKIILECKNRFKKEKTIVIQPFGSSAKFENLGDMHEILDDTNRSMSLFMYSKMVKSLSEKYNVILFAEQKFNFPEDVYTYKFLGDLRGYAAVISQCDYFVGCDSVGQHMARAFNKPGTVIFGSTFPENVSYPDWFQIIDKDKDKKEYLPLRISDVECHLADRLNQDCMNYSSTEIDNILAFIDQSMKKV